MQSFKTCPTCFEIWSTRDEFISDDHLEIIGYQADFEKLECGLFYFAHQKSTCGTTITIAVKDFKGLFSGKIYSERKAGSEGCPRYCLEKEQLDRCDAFCECAYVREIIQIIRNKRNTCQETNPHH